MTAARLLWDLEQRQVDLSLEGEQLRYRAPRGMLSDELRENISRHRAELRDRLCSAARLLAVRSGWTPSDDDLPMTPNQLWYLNTFEPETHKWALTLMLDVHSTISAELLQATVEVLVKQHDVFRMRQYRTVDGRWAQRILRSVDIPRIPVHDLSGLQIEECTRVVNEVGRQLQSTLSSIRGPVLALAVCRSRPNEDKIILSLHKYVVDGYAVNIVLDEIQRIYQDLSHGRHPEQRSHSSSYQDYLFALHEYEHRPMFVARALSFWGSPDRLELTEPLPADMAGGRHTDINSRRIWVHVEIALLRAAARSLKANEGVSFNNVLLFALARAYFQWSGNSALRLDFEHHGRGGVLPGMDSMRTIGPTTIKFPLLLKNEPATDARSAFQRLCEEVREATDNALGYGYLRYACADSRAGREIAACPPAQVFLNNRTALVGHNALAHSAQPAATQRPPSIRIMDFPEPLAGENLVSYDLMVECDDVGSAVQVSWVYSSAIHYEKTIRDLSQSFLRTLDELRHEDQS